MDSRKQFTRQILQRLGGVSADGHPLPAGGRLPTQAMSACPPVAMGGAPCVLVAVESAVPSSMPMAREVLSLGRFGHKAHVLADAGLAAALCRYAPAGQIHLFKSPPEGEAFGEVRALVAAASPEVLAKVALGMGDGPVGGMVMWALWRGLPVYMDLSCAHMAPNGTPCQNKQLAALYAGYRETLLALGVRHAGRGALLPALLQLLGQGQQGVALPPAAPDAGDAAEGLKRVFVTQKDVNAYTGGPEWALPHNAVITAAARDAAAQRKIVFRRAQGTPRGGKE